MQCSIVVNTYNREAYLRRLLPALERLQSGLFEIVVVDGPSTDGTAALLDAYRGRVKVVRCPDRNLSRSRNLGIAAAAGEIVVFIDDDALPVDERWLERFAAAFATDTTGRLGAVGGPVWHRDTTTPEFDGGVTSDYGIQVFDRASRDAFTTDGVRWVMGMPGGNCAIRRSALAAIGGFDEFYTYYLDETDVCFRLARAGYTIGYLPDNGIRHYAARADTPRRNAVRDWRTISRSDTYFALKNGVDPLPRRVAKTLSAAPRKHFAREILSSVLAGSLSAGDRLRVLGMWGAGLCDGLAAGVAASRRLGRFDREPTPLLPFVHEPRAAGRRLRVALLSQALPGSAGSGGIGRYTFDLARGLHERGHEVHLFHKSEQPLRRYSLGWVAHGIPPEAYAPPAGHPRPVLERNLRYALAVLRRMAELHAHGLSFDVVHASNWNAEAAAVIRAGVYPTVLMLVSPLAQVIATEHWEASDDLRACVGLDAWQIGAADAVCAPSEGVLTSYRALMEITGEVLARVRTVPLGIVPDGAGRLERPGAGRKRLLFVGRLERRKGVHTLLDALPELLATFPEWECHLVGDDRVTLAEGGTMREQFLARHRGAAWLGRVVFHGQVPEGELTAHYRACDLFVAPSLFESFGLIYHEAMQYGKAVVGCRAGGVPEVVADEVEGLLVPPDSPCALREALARLMRDEGLRRRMGEAGARRVRGTQSYRAMTEALERIYYETIERTAGEHHVRREKLWGAPA
jgi:glycosyltransferase involved in cell wall biosynthesis/GT2 family glycosyltransferase